VQAPLREERHKENHSELGEDCGGDCAGRACKVLHDSPRERTRLRNAIEDGTIAGNPTWHRENLLAVVNHEGEWQQPDHLAKARHRTDSSARPFPSGDQFHFKPRS
jgi:hypothetical protein